MWVKIPYKPKGLTETGSFCHDLDFWVTFEQVRNQLTHDFIVFSQKHIYCHRGEVYNKLGNRFGCSVPGHSAAVNIESEGLSAKSRNVIFPGNCLLGKFSVNGMVRRRSLEVVEVAGQGGAHRENLCSGIDLGKTVFHLVGLDASGQMVVRKRCSRTQLLAFTANFAGAVDWHGGM